MTGERVREGPDRPRPRRPARRTSTPIPDELKHQFVDAFWHSLAWRDTTWLGHRVAKAPTDLFVVPGDRAAGAARLDHRDRHRQRRARAVPRVDLRAARPRPGRVDRPRSRPTTAPSTRASPTSKARAAGRRRRCSGCARSSATRRARCVVLGSQPGTNLRIEAEFKVYRRSRAGRLVRGRSSTRSSTAIRCGPGSARARCEAVQADPRRATATSRSTPRWRSTALTFNPGGYLKRLR